MTKICIILPSLNEEQAIGKVIDEIPRQRLEQAGYSVQVLVVDGDSIDRTRDIAQEKGATVLVEPLRGKGNAVRSALKSVDADYIFMLDADNSYPAAYIADMVEVLQRHDVVVGLRSGGSERGAMSRLNLAGNKVLSLLATVLYGRRTRDLCTGYWGFRGDVMRGLNLRATGFELEADLFGQLSRKGHSMAEFPVCYRRRAGNSKLRLVRDGARISWTLLSGRFRRL